MQILPSNMPLDFLPVHPPHSRSNSVSSSSTHSSNSRPQSSQGGLSRLPSGMGPSAEDLFRASYHLGQHTNSISNDHHVRHEYPSSWSVTDCTSSCQSPPNHNISNPALKSHLRPSHIRARAAASPYPRDTDSVHSSSSETEDISMFLGNSVPDYSMFGGSHGMGPAPETMHAAGAFGRMTLSTDHALEKLAANVRAATTTSASDRAKQIFVQAWFVLLAFGYLQRLSVPATGLPLTTRHTLTATFLGKGFTFPIGGSVTNMGYPTSTRPPLARRSDFVFPLSKLDA